MLTVAIVTEEKLILSLRNITDVNVYLDRGVGVDRHRQEWAQLHSPGLLPALCHKFSSPLFLPEDRGVLRQAPLLEMWDTSLRQGSRYLVQPTVGGDLVVPHPDIGQVVIDVAQPHLWKRGLGGQSSWRTQDFSKSEGEDGLIPRAGCYTVCLLPFTVSP